MTNGNIPITSLQIVEKKGQLLKGECKVNGVTVLFYYHPKSDSFTAASLLDSEADLYMTNPPQNWKYLICGSIAHEIKNSVNHD